MPQAAANLPHTRLFNGEVLPVDALGQRFTIGDGVGANHAHLRPRREPDPGHEFSDLVDHRGVEAVLWRDLEQFTEGREVAPDLVPVEGKRSVGRIELHVRFETVEHHSGVDVRHPRVLEGMVLGQIADVFVQG